MRQLQEKLGARLREFRLASGYSIEELAHKADMNAAQLGKIERGERNFTIQTLDRIVRALGIRYTQLFDFETEVPSSANAVLDKTLSYLSVLSAQEQAAIYKTVELLAAKGEKRE